MVADPGQLEFSARRPVGLLLETLHEHDPAAGVEEVHDSVDVGLALLTQLPEVTLKVANQRETSLYISGLELFH